MQLYHYTTFSGALGILSSRSIWASCIHFLNDKEEFRHGIDLASGIADSLIHTQGPNGKRFLQKIVQMLPALEKRFLCVASFTENGNLLSQWRGYATSGGVSFGFRKSALEAAGGREQFQLRKCIYENAQKIEIITRDLESYLKDIEAPNNSSDGEIWNRANDWVFAFQVHASCFKHESFAEENEWRLVSGLIPEYGARVAVRPGPGLPIPYFTLPLQQAVVNGLIDLGLHSIMVGPHHDQELAERALDIAVATNNVRFAGITRSSIPYRTV
ncbi:DUF2971 domain-containing protein [Rhizobium mayense]|uniref:DUF2971 domain-containing protein n=1 Tax=Rhizobium mayense TaxID=1312184 RepID=A0ABT7K0S2_9HYPH|nr:DUF2971 domain-containing protein [Rhizobium mayense]MDL2401585.1 DUF2971 domain-containing protein [Rhizobium mayense]